MKAAVITKFGGPGVFALRDAPPPALTPDGVRIRVRAAGVNFADTLMRMGMYPEAPKPPFVPGYEVAGEVMETGAAVPAAAGLSLGTRVLAGTRFGGYCEELVVPAAIVRPIPAVMTFEEAASVPVVWLTAWLAAVEMARVRAGDRVLVESAAGGVGTAAVQLCVAAGATVVGLTGSPSKVGAIRGMGADAWTMEEWRGRAKYAERFDVVLNSAGGKDLKRAYDALAPTGRVVTFGVSSMVLGNTRSLVAIAKAFASMPFYTPIKLMMANKGVFGLNVLKLMDGDAERLGGGLDLILRGFAEGKYRAVVGKTFPLAEAGAAHEFLTGRGNVGKVVLTT